MISALPAPVIVVDDERLDRAMVRRRLEPVPEFGPLLEFDDGDTFLAALREAYLPVRQGPVLILMDINMRRMNGFETVCELQTLVGAGAAAADFVVAMLTSSENERDRLRSRNLSLVGDYLTKPLDADGIGRLIALVRSWPVAASRRNPANASPQGDVRPI